MSNEDFYIYADFSSWAGNANYSMYLAEVFKLFFTAFVLGVMSAPIIGISCERLETELGW